MTLRRRQTNERGFILVAVLWMALGLLLGTSAFLSQTRTEALTLRAEVETTRAVELARSAVNLAMADLANQDSGAPADGTETVIAMAEGQALYRIQDERGKLSLGKAPIELLRPALIAASRGAGADAFDAAGVADAIVAARDGTGLVGGSTRDILAGLGFGAQAASRAEAVLSPFNFEPTVNPMTAPISVLASIPGLGPSDVERILTRRASGQPMPRVGSAAVWLSNQSGPVYTIRATGVLASGTRAEMVAVVAEQGLSFRGGRMRYEILSAQIVR